MIKILTTILLFAFYAFASCANAEIVVSGGGGSSSLPTQTGNSGKYLTTDGSNAAWNNPSGSGDVTGGVASSDSEVVLYSGSGGKTLKRSNTLSGIAKLTSGVLTAAAAGTDYLAPNGSAAALTSFPTLNQNTTGTAAGLTAQYVDWNASSGGASIANKPAYQAGDTELTAIAGLTFADISVIQLTGAGTASVLTCTAANQLIGVNADGDALECKSTLDLSALNMGASTSSIPCVVGTSTAPTTEGSCYWNSSTDVLTIGNGTTATTIGSGGSGDITAVGSCTTGSCATIGNGATSAGYIDLLEDSDNGTNRVRLQGAASTADVTVTLPAETGTVCTTGSVCSGYQASGSYQASDQDLTDIAALSCTQNQIAKKGASAWECGADSTGGSPTFDSVASGTNTTAAMVVGSGGSLRSAAGILGLPNSTSLPGTCTVGDIYMDTDATTGQRLYACESTNTWAKQGDGAGGGSGDVTGGSVSVDGEIAVYNSTTGKVIKQSFAAFTGPASTVKTYTLPNADSTLLYSGGALGTPSGGTLTNATGLPVAGIAASTSTALGVGSVELGHASDTTIARASAGVATIEGVTLTRTIASGTSALGTGAITSATCATVVTTSATGTATTDVINWGFNGDPTAVTGYAPSAAGMLTIIAYPSANNVNYKVCNNTAGSITPGAITLNWVIVR